MKDPSKLGPQAKSDTMKLNTHKCWAALGLERWAVGTLRRVGGKPSYCHWACGKGMLAVCLLVA